MEHRWDIGDGYYRWCRGISQTKFLITLVRPELIAYVSGCHIKYAKLTLPNCEVTRMFHPGLEGIELLEGNPQQSVYAIAEMAKKPKISIYKVEIDHETLVSELRGSAENEYRAVKFAQKELLLVLTGIPEFTISLWRWSTAEELMVVNCLDKNLKSDLLINTVRNNVWAEWSACHLTVYELQDFGESNIVRTSVSLPESEVSSFRADPRMGEKYMIDLVSVAWSYTGELYVLDGKNSLYKVAMDIKNLQFLGKISFEDETGDVVNIVPYDSFIGAILDNGTFWVLEFTDEEICVKTKFEFPSAISKLIENQCATHPKTSFYAITDIDHKIESVLDGKHRTPYTLLDLTLSEIKDICFIEREAKYVGVVTERGGIYILDSNTGNILTKWKLPFYAESMVCHPLLPYVAVGTADGCVIIIHIKQVKKPRIIYRTFLKEETEIDKVQWTCRGRYLIAGDTQRGHLFMLYGIPSMEFHYLDYSQLPGQIRSFNTPANYKDKRLNVLIVERESDEVPFQLNNYRLDADSLELVAAQIFDCPMTSLCFSSFKRLMYCYSCENSCVGMNIFTEDMQAGSMKEPEIQFDQDYLPLHVNRILLHGDKLLTLGEDGFTTVNVVPSPKATKLKTDEIIQTHFPSYNGIKDGVLSMNGAHLITIGHDNTFVHIQLGEDLPNINWAMLGYGLDMSIIIDCQTKYLDVIDLERNPEIKDNEIDCYTQSRNEEHACLAGRSEVEVKGILASLTQLRKSMKNLLDLNESRKPYMQLPIEEFEIDEESEKLAKADGEQDKEIAEIIIKSIIEERDRWTENMKALIWDQFEVTSRRMKGFHFGTEVQNYPLTTITETEEFDILRQERYIEQKLHLVEDEIQKAKNAAHIKLAHLKKKKAARLAQRFEDTEKGPEDMSLMDMMEFMSDDDLGSMKSSTGTIYDQDMLAIDEEEERGEFDSSEEEEGEDEYEEFGGEGSEDVSRKSSEASTSTTYSGSSDSGSFIDSSSNLSIKESEVVEDDDKDLDDQDSQTDLLAAQIEAEVAKVRAEQSERLLAARKAQEAADAKAKGVLLPTQAILPPDHEHEGEGQSEIGEQSDEYEEEEEEFHPKKKRRIVWKKLHEEDDLEVEVEESDSSDESDEDYEKQITRFTAKQIHQEKALSKEEKEKHDFIKQLYSGSLTCEIFEPNRMLYDQLDLAAFSQIKRQIKLILSEIRKLKITFNEHFEEVRANKGIIINEIDERNKRIDEIAGLFGIIVYHKPQEYFIYEDPGQVFEVKEEEITVEKYVTEEEQRLEQARLEEEERRRLLAEKRLARVAGDAGSDEDSSEEEEPDVQDTGDDVGIEDSLKILAKLELGQIEEEVEGEGGEDEDKDEEEEIGGEDMDEYQDYSEEEEEGANVSEEEEEAEPREAILFKIIPMPEFMVEKEQWEWNEDEYERAVEYQKQVDELDRLKQEYKRELQMELRGLIRSNSESKAQLDAEMKKLFELKIQVEMSIKMEEIKICRMVHQIIKRYELENDEIKMIDKLDKIQETLRSTQSIAAQLIARVENCSKRHEAVIERERNLEKTFKTDLGEVRHFFDAFARLYKKRPNIKLPKNEKMSEIYHLMIEALDASNLRSFAANRGEIGQIIVEAIYELDDPMACPIGCPRSTWNKFCRIRREKIVCEYENKLVANELNSLKSVLDECKQREEDVTMKMSTMLSNLATQRDKRLGHVHNVELQMTIKQGQIELPRSLLREDFYNALMLKKNLLQDCNVLIRKFGGMKLASLHKSKDQHRTVKQIEWEFRKIQLTEKHWIEKRKDISNTRVTKEILEFLKSDDYELLQKNRLSRIHKLQNMAEEYHKKHMDLQGKSLRNIQRAIEYKSKDSEMKEELIEKRNLKVSEIKSLCNVQNPADMVRAHRERMQTIMRCAYLTRRISKNAEEIFCLETELDRLYKKTFPIL